MVSGRSAPSTRDLESSQESTPRTVRRLRHHGGQHLQHVVLDDVPDGAGVVVEPAAVGHVEGLRHGDLDALDIVAVEQRLDHRVGEPREHHTVQRIQAQPVVHPVDVVLGEVFVHGRVERLRAGQITAERLFDHHPGALRPAGAGDALGDAAEQERRHLEIEQCLAARTHLLRHRRIGGGIVEITVHVTQQAEQLDGRRGGRVHVVELERGRGVVPELLDSPTALRHTDDRNVQDAAVDQPDQRRERLQFGEIPGRSEDHQRVHRISCHQLCLHSGCAVTGDDFEMRQAAGAVRSAHLIRSAMWSATRNALAMAVSDGFTAPMLGKKLVSTT